MVAALCVWTGLLVIFTGSQTASAAASAKPVVTSFSAEAVNPNGYEELASSPLTLYSGGGLIRLVAHMTGGAVCTFSSNHSLAGMPYSVPCTTFAASLALAVPANTGRRDMRYKFKLRVIGQATAHAVPLDVVVSTTPNPTSATPVAPGTKWFLESEPNCTDPGWWQVGFEAGGLVFASNFDSGSYSVGQNNELFLHIAAGAAFGFDLMWNDASDAYTGTDDIFHCSWTLVPLPPGF